MKSRARDDGAALIAALMMVAILAALSIVVVDAAGAALRRASNQSDADQNRWYLRGAETYAIAKIRQLRSAQAAASTLIDEREWQGRAFTFPLDDGVLTITLWDGGNCFNLNGLVTEEESGALRASGLGRVAFAQVLDALSIRVENQLSLSTAVADWIDSDLEPEADGAEDSVYAQGADPYRTANGLIADASEIRRVRGVTPEIAAALAPYICARPTPALLPINLNTLRLEQAPLLSAALGGFIGVREAEDIIRLRPTGGWRDVDAFFAQARLGGLERSAELAAMFTTQPLYYVMTARVRRGESSESCAVLMGGGDAPRVLRRVCGVGAAERVL